MYLFLDFRNLTKAPPLDTFFLLFLGFKFLENYIEALSRTLQLDNMTFKTFLVLSDLVYMQWQSCKCMYLSSSVVFYIVCFYEPRTHDYHIITSLAIALYSPLHMYFTLQDLWNSETLEQAFPSFIAKCKPWNLPIFCTIFCKQTKSHGRLFLMFMLLHSMTITWYAECDLDPHCDLFQGVIFL